DRDAACTECDALAAEADATMVDVAEGPRDFFGARTFGRRVRRAEMGVVQAVQWLDRRVEDTAARTSESQRDREQLHKFDGRFPQHAGRVQARHRRLGTIQTE